MKVFKLNDVYSVVCDTKNTRNGFKHEATLLKNSFEVFKTKINYLNRTWERFEYERILYKIVNDYFDNSESIKYKEIIKQF